MTDNLEDLPKETLLNICKEKVIQSQIKLRESKQQQKKLDKLQEKYVVTFKEHKLLTKDRETLLQVLSGVLNEPEFQMPLLGIGQYEVGPLMELLKTREDSQSKTLFNLIKETNNEKLQLEEKYRQAMSETNQESRIALQLKQQKQQMADLEQNNTRLAKEIIELNDIIQLKNNKIEELQNLEEELVNIRTQTMVKQLQQSQGNREEKMRQSEQLNEHLKVKQQMDKLMEEIQRLKSQLRHYEEMAVQVQLKPNKDYDNPFEEEIVQVAQTPKQEFADNHTQTLQLEDDHNANMEYLKNVVFKYFLYSETRNYKEAQMLMGAIMTILKMTQEERNRIEQAKNRGFLQNAKSTLSESLFCMKPSQLNDMELKVPQTKISRMNMHMN